MSKLTIVSMLELDEGFEHVKEEFGANLYKAADWRYACPWLHNTADRAPYAGFIVCSLPV
jgi:hypothetical protein